MTFGGVPLLEIITNRHFRKTAKYLRTALFIGACATIIFFISVFSIYTIAKLMGPPPLAVPQSTIYFAEDGTVIGETDIDGQKRYWVNVEDISPHLIESTISVEDKRFYKHLGFDFRRIAGAILADIKSLSKAEGASTISQQYARNLFLSHDKTWTRKLTEAFYTIRLEVNYSKKEILEGYLNTIYYGHGAYGVEAASQFYFGKSSKDLTLAEAAMLAGIPKGPSIYSPIESIDHAKDRQEIILESMVKNGFISKEEAETALKEDIQVVGKHLYKDHEIAPYFQDVVTNLLKTKLGIDERTIDLGGLKVYTTLNPTMQKIAEDRIKNTIASESDIQLGFVAMEPKTGHVKALVGGRDYEKSTFNRAIQALRQPGSTIKPILYYAALERGFTPSTTLRSELTTFKYDDGRESYTPHNFNNLYANKEVTLAQALALSDNVYAVKTHLFLGMDTLVDYAKKFGISTELEKVPSLALGTSGVRVIDMVNAYSHFANGGYSVEPVFITKVENAQGDVIFEHEGKEERILDKDKTFVMTHMMTGIFDRRLNGYSTVTGSSVADRMTRTYAGKSGSTDTDSWMIGFTPQLVSGIWTGYDQGKDITLAAEKTYAKEIWISFMEEALKSQPKKTFKPTKDVVGVYIDPESGFIATEDCPVSRLTYFEKGTEPQEHCKVHSHKSEKEKKKNQKEEPKKKERWYERIFDWIS